MGKEELDCFRQLGPSGRTLTPASNIGINTLPDQFVNIELTKGFTFNLMCVGVSGIGKTTLLRSLFRINLQDDSHPTRSNDVLLTERELSLSEASVSLRVKLIESRGFGDQINKSDNSRNVVKYIEEKFESYYREESRVCRQLDKVGDGLVHACIYMLEPTGASLSTLDIITLKELQTRVNVILVIGKSDSLTPSELKDFKKRIMEELLEKGVELYKCPTDDPTVSTKNCELNLHIPFAVVASTEEMLINNQLCRVRKYPWGSVNVDDESHCEFTHLREALLRNNLYHLIQTTHSKFFYRFRAEQLSKDKPTGDSLYELK
ncbi:Septin-8-A [Thelohanellus kitauei]|uniref:Septin-8-A n=1 Tax=Thelohanellus kitauei TaxID=669202 RepID=A0A0C2MYP7_THEKT|nr:Septin-8-A [Thelohanellus kitauei]